MDDHRIYTMAFASVYPHYVTKVEKKGRTRQELDEIICWLTGYTPKALAKQLEGRVDFRTFFDQAPRLHPDAKKITGTICGVRIEEIEHPLMRKIRYLDKVVDELAKGRPMEKIQRKSEPAPKARTAKAAVRPGAKPAAAPRRRAARP